MREYWEFVANAASLFNLVVGSSVYGAISWAYRLVKERIDVNQSINMVSKRSGRVWYWVAFGFFSAYIAYFLYSFAVVGIASYTQILAKSEDAEDLLGVLLWDLPVVTVALLVGYIYGRKFFKQ